MKAKRQQILKKAMDADFEWETISEIFWEEFDRKKRDAEKKCNVSKRLMDSVDTDFNWETISETSRKAFAKERRKAEKERDVAFREAINELARGRDWIGLVAALRLFSDKNTGCPVVEGCPDQTDFGCKEMVDALETEQVIADCLVEKSEQLYKKATDNKSVYKLRNKWLERAVRILLDLFDDPESPEWKYDKVRPSWQICHLISKCYLKRGLSILPKGKGVSAPEKKLEAMKKSLKWIGLAHVPLEQEQDKLTLNFTQIQSLYELWRLGEEEYLDELKTAVEKAVSMPGFNSSHPSDVFFVLDLHCRFYDDPKSDKAEVIFTAEITESDEEVSPSLLLIQANAGLRIYKRNHEKETAERVKEKAGAVIGKLKKYELFSPVWDDIIECIKEIKHQKIEGWQELSLKAWKICHEKERQMGCGLQIRQHWSRLSDIYDLAVEAALKNNELLEAVKVIDSLKSRTPLTWNEMDAFLSDQTGKDAERIKKWREQFYLMESHTGMGIYAPNYGEIKKNLLKKFKPDKKNVISYEKIPPEWTAVHFYLKEKENDKLECLALAGRKKSDDSDNAEWEYIESFDITPVWVAYKKWREKYINLPSGNKDESHHELSRLCEKIGETMLFLFEIAEKSKGIIFIPHGFMHQLPLHAAKHPQNPKDGTYLFQNTCSTYIPAWSLISEDALNPDYSGRYNYCCRYFPENQSDYYREIYESDYWNHKKDDADSSTLAEFNDDFQRVPPECFSILCHGKADEVYSFKSVLELGSEGISFLDLQLIPLNLSGAKVLLGACESELSPIRETQIDEHLSLAGIFLSKGASLVTGTMWKCPTVLFREIAESAFPDNEKKLWEIIQGKQADWMGESPPVYWGNKDPNISPETFAEYPEEMKLYYTALFRCMGYPAS
ncbi:type III-E CRISPR-associated TPR-CHAT protein Csx29 [Desulfococcaceae bacterium HSG8]|nr:type III-E CRISPR-associated TPR-CHAT protein Csx29 [Desulfococcaceae bacterium HSG8]